MSSSSPPPPSPTTATMSSPSPPPPSPTTATMLSPSPPRNQPQMVVNRSSVFRQHPEMVVHFPSGPRKQPVINPPFEYRQHPQMVIPSFTKSDFLEINDATDDSDPSTFQMNSVDAVGIPPSWNEDKIKEAFQEFGHIEQVLLASKRNKITTIKYTTQEGALSCIASFSKKKLTNNGRKVNVHVSLAKPEQKDKRIEERSRSRKKSKLNQKEDELEFPVMWPKTSLESLMSLDSFNHKASAIPRPTGSSGGLESDSTKEGQIGTTLVAVATPVCILMGSETRTTSINTNICADGDSKVRPLGDFMKCAVGGNLNQVQEVYNFMLQLVTIWPISLRELRVEVLKALNISITTSEKKWKIIILVGDRRATPSEAIWVLDVDENVAAKDLFTSMATGGSGGAAALSYLETHFDASHDRLLLLKNVVRAIHAGAFQDGASGGTSYVYTANSSMTWKTSNVCRIGEFPG